MHTYTHVNEHTYTYIRTHVHTGTCTNTYAYTCTVGPRLSKHLCATSNVKGVQINEFVRISELSDKIHYVAS